LEGFNYRFKNNGSVKEAESIPAYKRQGLDIDTSVRPSQQDETSGMSIDEEGLKSNNRFLHDNVD
jgi:cell division protein FtsZ